MNRNEMAGRLTARTGHNARKREAISLSASTPPTFKTGKMLKDVVNAGPGS